MVALAHLQVDSRMAPSPGTFPKVSVYFPTKQMFPFSIDEGPLLILWVRWLLCPYTPGFQDQMLVIPWKFTSDDQAKQRSLPQFLDTFCTEPRVDQKQWLSIGLETTTQAGYNIFLDTLECPGLPSTGSTTPLAMPATPSPGSTALGRGRDQDRLTGKQSPKTIAQSPPRGPGETAQLQELVLLMPHTLA